MALNLPSLYDFYTSGGTHSGLSVNQPYFTLNDKNVTLYSGAMHYFRVPKDYWRDRLQKMKYAGLNTVETYIPWNLHEPSPGQYDFGNGNSDMEYFLDIKHFLQLVKEEDMFAIVRPGPYICAEFEFGGLPSWLLREKNIKLRTSDDNYMKHVVRYFNVLLTILATLQFTRGGPIIAFQVENEYGSTSRKNSAPDLKYMEQLRYLMVLNNITELLLTSDGASYGSLGTIPKYFFQTINFKGNPDSQFNILKKLQPNKPLMVMEYWSGWFDHWSEKHFSGDPKSFKENVDKILKHSASINFYMFHGGTSWGFLNGANLKGNQSLFKPTVTSYDYDAPLNEYGGYTEKFFIIKELIEKYSTIKLKPAAYIRPKSVKAFGDVNIKHFMPYVKIKQQLPYIIVSDKLVPMELLPINNNAGQSFGYIIYRKANLTIKADSALKLQGYVHDCVMIYVNDRLISKPLEQSNDLNAFGYWRLENSSIVLTNTTLVSASLDILVTNLGRNNFGNFETLRQFKGLLGDVYINNNILRDWEIMPMEFRTIWNNNLKDWNIYQSNNLNGAALYRADFQIEKPQDTFLDMSKWKMGIVIVNGFVLGRYMHIGPQQTLYLPGPLLNSGQNTIIVFEHFSPDNKISFTNKPIYLVK